MAAKYAAVVTYNGLSMAMSVASKNWNNVVGTADSGVSSVHSFGEITEVQKMLQSRGFTVQVTQYTTGDLLTHAKNDALALAGTL